MLRPFRLTQAASPFAVVVIVPTIPAASTYQTRLHFWPQFKAPIRVHVAHLPRWMVLRLRQRLRPILSLLLHLIVILLLAHFIVRLVFPVLFTTAILILRLKRRPPRHDQRSNIFLNHIHFCVDADPLARFCVDGMVVVGGGGAGFPEHPNNTKKC